MKAGHDDPWLARVGEVSLRMMAGAIPKRTQERIQKLMAANADTYPWQEVVDAVMADEPGADLVERGLRGQRDWFARAAVPATARAGRAARVAGKTALAYVLSQAIFFAIYTGAVVFVLNLAKHHWPAFDIYAPLEWARSVAPGVFGR